MAAVEYEVSDRVARLTLNRPARGNGITRALVTELERAVEAPTWTRACTCCCSPAAGRASAAAMTWSNRQKGRAGSGPGPGAQAPPGSPLDPLVMMANHDPGDVWDPMIDYAMMSRNVRAFMSLFHCSKPVVCKVHGFCVAGGTDMALCSDLLVIAADAKIGYPPARVWGSPTTSLWAYRLGPQRAKRLLFTGDCLSGDEALEWGLAIEAPPAGRARPADGGAGGTDRAGAGQPAADDEDAGQPVALRAGAARHPGSGDDLRRDHPAHQGGLRLPAARGRGGIPDRRT